MKAVTSLFASACMFMYACILHVCDIFPSLNITNLIYKHPQWSSIRISLEGNKYIN